MYDAIVVGARCAGSPTAMLLTRKGYRVLLVDKASFPSDVVNGYQVQQLAVARLKRWGLLDKLRASNCPSTKRPCASSLSCVHFPTGSKLSCPCCQSIGIPEHPLSRKHLAKAPGRMRSPVKSTVPNVAA